MSNRRRTATKEVIEKVRSDVLNLCLFIFGVGSFLVIIGFWYNILLNVWDINKFIYSVLAAALVSFVVFRSNSPFAVRSIALIAFLALAGGYGMFVNGPYSPAVIFIVAVPVFVTLHFGTKAGVISFSACLICYLALGLAGLVFELFEVVPRYVPGVNLVYDWYILSIVFVATSSSVALSIRKTLFSMSDILIDLEAERRSLKKAREKAEAANKAKSNFLSAMSHDLRTPLNPVLGFAEIIENRMMGDHAVETYSKYARDIREAGQSLLKTLGRILDLSKLEAGAVDLVEEEIDLVELAQGVVDELEELADERKVRLVIDVVMPRIIADRHLIHRALRSLTENAARHSPPGETVSVFVDMSAAHATRITVNDNGPGIPQEIIERVGEPFIVDRDPYQASDSTGHNSVGLGLSIVTRLVGLHGGSLLLSNRPHGGASATIMLPPTRTVHSPSLGTDQAPFTKPSDAVRRKASSVADRPPVFMPAAIRVALGILRDFARGLPSLSEARRSVLAASRSPINQTRLDQVRSDVCNMYLAIVFPFVLVATLLFLGNFIYRQDPVDFPYIVVGFAFIVFFIFRRRVSLILRSVVLIGFLFYAGAMSVTLYGPYATGNVFLMSFPVYCGLLLGARAGSVALAVSILVFVGFGAASNVFEVVEIRQRFLNGGDPVYDWVLLATAFAMTGLSMTVAVSKTIDAMTDTLENIERERQSHKLARDRAEAASKAKADFLSAMSHDLRAPLNPILGFAEIIEKRLMGDDAMERYSAHAGSIREAGQDLLETLGTILDLSKLEAGELELSEEPVDLVSTAREVTNIIVGRPEARQKTFAFEGNALRVMADPHMVRRIIFNLIDNAVRYAPDGGRVTVRLGLTPDNSVKFSVIDAGPGIPSEVAAHLGEPFVVGGEPHASAMEPQKTAVGLGLSIVTRLMTLHDGSFSIRNREGGGAIATLTFPPERIAPMLATHARVDKTSSGTEVRHSVRTLAQGQSR